MDIIQTFYDNMATWYDKLFLDWEASTNEQALILDKLFKAEGFDKKSKILDCACGIGTQAIGLASLGYDITASDISEGELGEARRRCEEHKVSIAFKKADFRALEEAFCEKFDIIIAMDNALPHMLTAEDLKKAAESIISQLNDGGMLVASIRDYDALIKDKPSYSPPYIHKTEKGQRVSFQTWKWEGDNYKLTQYIIDDEEKLKTGKFECEYRAVRRNELTDILICCGCDRVEWKFTGKTGFYQPIIIAKKVELEEDYA